MSTCINICDGCCCGRVEKGHNEVPVNELKRIWEKNKLHDKIKLTLTFDIVRYLSFQPIADDHNTTGWFD